MSMSGDFGKCEVRNWWIGGKVCVDVSMCGSWWTGTWHHHPINHPRYHHQGMFVWIFGFSDVWMGNGTKWGRKLTKPDFKIHCVEVGNQMMCTNVSCNFVNSKVLLLQIDSLVLQSSCPILPLRTRGTHPKYEMTWQMFESAVVAWEKQ